MCVQFNLDEDLQARLVAVVQPSSPAFAALPVGLQLDKLGPLLREQRRRDSRRLRGFLLCRKASK
jgi:hypothetical protein